jgi:hypothetical protein
MTTRLLLMQITLFLCCAANCSIAQTSFDAKFDSLGFGWGKGHVTSRVYLAPDENLFKQQIIDDLVVHERFGTYEVDGDSIYFLCTKNCEIPVVSIAPFVEEYADISLAEPLLIVLNSAYDTVKNCTFTIDKSFSDQWILKVSVGADKIIKHKIHNQSSNIFLVRVPFNLGDFLGEGGSRSRGHINSRGNLILAGREYVKFSVLGFYDDMSRKEKRRHNRKNRPRRQG